MQPLLALQEMDARIRALQQEIQDIPLRREQETGRLKGAQEAQAVAHNGLRVALAAVVAAEGEVTDRRERITKLRQQQSTLKTNREFQAMNLEIATIEADIEACEARQLARMDEVNPSRAKLTECDARLKEEQAVIDGYLKELDARLAEAKAELAKAEAERRAAAQSIDSRMLLHYGRLLTKRWPPVVPLEGGTVCGGCHLTQPPSVGHMVRRDAGLVACQMCGRILYKV
jgi:predicted  nucleic acid-binding Zn-ribbon protein